MLRSTGHKVLFLSKADAAARDVRHGDSGKLLTAQAGSGPREFPVASISPRLPAMIPDEILDYYGWVFCQGGFQSMDMTFEGFLSVVAAVSPSGLRHKWEIDETGLAAE